MTFQQFLQLMYSDAGRAAFGAACWGVTGWLVEYIAQKRGVTDISNDDKRLFSLGVVVLVTLAVQLAAIAAGYANNTIEGWFRVVSEIGMTAVVLFTFTKKVEGTSAPPAGGAQ